MKKKASFDKEGSSFNKGSFVSQRTPSQKFSRNVTKLFRNIFSAIFPTELEIELNCAKFLRTPLLTEHLLATASLYCGVTDRAQKIKCNLFSNDREKGNESRKNNPFQTNVPFYFNFSYFLFFFFWRININLNFTSK